MEVWSRDFSTRSKPEVWLADELQLQDFQLEWLELQGWVIYFPFVLGPAFLAIGNLFIIWESSGKLYRGEWTSFCTGHKVSSFRALCFHVLHLQPPEEMISTLCQATSLPAAFESMVAV